MSVFNWRSRWSSWRPVLEITDSTLHFQTSLWVQLYGLFAFRRDAVVCRRSRMVTISTRKYWFFTHSEEIPFSRIKTPGMRVGFLKTSWGWNWEAHDGVERCIIYLDLVDPNEEVIVTTTIGGAPVMTGWMGVLMGDSLIDHSGTQIEDAEDYVNLLKQYTATTLR